MLSVVEIALEKSVLGMKSLGEKAVEAPMFSTMAGYNEGAIVGYDYVLDVDFFVRPDQTCWMTGRQQAHWTRRGTDNIHAPTCYLVTAYGSRRAHAEPRALVLFVLVYPRVLYGEFEHSVSPFEGAVVIER